MGFNSSKDFGFGNGAASGGGGGGLTSVSTCNTNTFSFYGDGTIVNPLCGCPTLSSFANQGTLVLNDGLWSPNPIRNGLVYGGVITWLQNYDYSVSAAGYYINGVFYTSPQTTVTLSPSDPTLDRIDLFVVTTSGTATSITGTPANPPQSPTIDPDTELDISFALVTAGSTQPTVTSQYIYLNNAEWVTSVSSPTINPASPNNPFSAALDVEFTNTPLNANVTFTTAPFTILPTYQNLILYIRSKTTFPTNRNLLLTFRNGATTVGAGVVISGNSTPYGFNSSITGSYQRISIPLANFGLSYSSIVNSFRIQVAGAAGTGNLNLYVDNIEIQSGTQTPDSALNLYVPSLGFCSTIRCNVNNVAISQFSSALAGRFNSVNTSSSYSSILSGRCNSITTSNNGVILGGQSNTLTNSSYSFIGGGRCNSSSSFNDTFIIGSCITATQACTTFVNCLSAQNLTSGCQVCVGTNGVLQNFAGSGGSSGVIILGAGTLSSVRCGVNNTSSGNYSAALGGQCNTSSSLLSTIVGGEKNLAQGVLSFIGGGECNNVCNSTSGCLALGSVVVGGVGNNTSGGTWDIATCTFTVAPTICNAGQYSFIGGGFQNRAGGDFSFNGGGGYNNICNTTSCCSLGAVVVGGIGNNTTGGSFNVTTCNLAGQTRCNAGAYSFIGSGFQNRATENSAVVISGTTNTASGCCSFVGTGQNNTATVLHAFVGNGQSNNATGNRSFIGSGINHTASGLVSVLVGGNQNTVSSYGGAILGGRFNVVAGGFSSIVGGVCNVACSGLGTSFIGGGVCNIVEGTCNVIVGGVCNIVVSNGFGSFIGAGRNNSIQAYTSFIGGGIWNTICGGTPEFSAYSAVVSGIGNNTTGGTWVGGVTSCFTVAPTPINLVGCHSFIGSGFQNRTIGDGSAIVGGNLNLALGNFSVIGGGFCNNICNNTTATTACNRCLALGSVVVGGVGNNTTGGTWDLATCTFTVAPALCNTCQYSFVGGGFQNHARGEGDVVVGGECNGSIACSLGNNFIGGGFKNILAQNTACGFIGGGECNVVNCWSVVVGGCCNCGVGSVGGAFIGGGYCNITTQGAASIVGGFCNFNNGSLGGFIGGGRCNTIFCSTDYSGVITGGSNNLICKAQCSIIGGGSANTIFGGGVSSGGMSGIFSGRLNIVSNDTALTGALSSIVGGFCNSITSICSFIGAGFRNTVSGNGGVIVGGNSNISSNCFTTIVGGNCNTSSSYFSTIVGGERNLAQGVLSFIGGGECNNVCNSTSGCLAIGSVVVGGIGNNTTGGTWDLATCTFTSAPTICNAGQYSFIGGGFQNRASADTAIVVGGCLNNNSGVLSTISGGVCNTISNQQSFIGSGSCNTISSTYGSITSGVCNIVSNSQSSILGGRENTASGSRSSTISGYRNVSSGTYASIINGVANTSTCTYSLVGSGSNNYATSNRSFIANGANNSVSGNYGVIINGKQNTTQASFGFIGNGVCNNVCNSTSGCLALGSVVVGGVGNNTCGGTWDLATCTFTLSPTICNAGQYSFIGGGFQNISSGSRSSVLGGQLNNTCGFADAHIVGSCLNATQACTTFVNCLSAANIPSGCAVCATTNNVLVGFTTPNYNIGFFTQTANSTPISGTTTETSLINGGVGTLTVPANTFKVGDSFVAIIGGLVSADNNQTITVRIKAGSVVLVDSGAQTISNITNDVFTLNVNLTIRQIGATTVASIVTLGTFVYHKTSNSNVQSFAFNSVNSTTFDTTISNTLDITVQWGSTSAVNNIYSDIFTLNKTY